MSRHQLRTLCRDDPNELPRLAGVTGAFADKDSKDVMLSWEEPTASWEQIRTRLIELGFPPDAK